MKDRVRNSMGKYLARLNKSRLPKQTRSKNDNPEKRVELEVRSWLDLNGFKYTVIESKSVYSVAACSYMKGQAEIGCPDILGIDSKGLGVAIELKAPGRRKNLSQAQYFYLKAYLEQFAFSVVVTSSSELQSLYSAFQAKGKNEGRDFLRSQLPLPKLLRESLPLNAPLFDDAD